MIEISNSKKNSFLSSIPTASLDEDTDNLTSRCKFNFSYMDFTQKAGQKFEDWTNDQLTKLLYKINEYCKEPLSFWTTKSIGSGQKRRNILEIYGSFPRISEFEHPKHVPHQVLWARFRLEYRVRLIGFVIPKKYEQIKHKKTGQYFDINTFYVVFLDAEHKFYRVQKR